MSRSHLATVACLGAVTAVLDLGDLLWISYSTGWLLAILISAVAFGASVALRRSRPATALAVAGLGYAVAWAISLSEPRPVPTMAQAALWVAVFSAIVTGTDRLRLTAIITLGSSVALDAYAGIRMGGTEGFEPGFLIYSAVSVSFVPVVLVAVAEAVRGRIQLATAQADQAERLRQLDASAAVRDERLRLARELHDVVANRLSAVTMRITAEGHVRKHSRTPEGEALAEIGQEIGTALSELRSVLGTLRDDDADMSTATPPSLKDVELLAEEARRAGAEVDIVISGDPRALSSMVDLASYRIVQEALTNVARHAFPPRATVRLDYGTDQLRVRIEDDGVLQPGSRIASSGHGIIGIRERAALCDGWASAGPRPGGGWTVEAALPVKKDDS